MERSIERAVLMSRWLQVPMYVGLAGALIILSAKFFEELAGLTSAFWSIHESRVILAVLTLVDIVLVANLVVMVLIGGYENFVSKLDVGASRDGLPWLGKFGGGSIKIRLATSIVSISAIHLLGAFINYERVANEKLLLLLAIQLTFAASAMMVGMIDRMAAGPGTRTDRPHG